MKNSPSIIRFALAGALFALLATLAVTAKALTTTAQSRLVPARPVKADAKPTPKPEKATAREQATKPALKSTLLPVNGKAASVGKVANANARQAAQSATTVAKSAMPERGERRGAKQNGVSKASVELELRSALPSPYLSKSLLASRATATEMVSTARKGKKGELTEATSVRGSRVEPALATRATELRKGKLTAATETKLVSTKTGTVTDRSKLTEETALRAQHKSVASITTAFKRDEQPVRRRPFTQEDEEEERRSKSSKVGGRDRNERPERLENRADDRANDNNATRRVRERELPPAPNTSANQSTLTRPRNAPEREARESARDQQQPAPRETRELAEATPPVRLPLAYPDRIEVLEANSPAIEQLFTLPTTRPLIPFGAVVTKNNAVPGRRSDLNISFERTLEIQYELVKRGFYQGEPNGVYDEATIAAMWEFQKNYGLPATGYPSAHALKRLGLTNW